MADEFSSKLKEKIKNNGWIVGKFIGGGGGGKVYLCFKCNLLDVLFEAIRVGRLIRVENCMSLLDSFYSDLIAGGDGIAALKLPNSNSDKSVFKRLGKEIKAMSSISHPGLIKIRDYDNDEPPRWFVMELHPHGTLENQSKYIGKPKETLCAIRPVIEGVANLHGASYVHRDIKPRNIFININGQLVLGDFGIIFTRKDDRSKLTLPGETIFSRDWIPGWVRGRDLEDFSSKVDVFMLAKVIYYMLTGKNVFPGQLDEDDRNLKKLFPDVEGIDLIYNLLCDCIVEKEKNCKPESAGELLRSIDDLINDLDYTPRPQLIFNLFIYHSSVLIPIKLDLGYGDQEIMKTQIHISQRYKQFMAKAMVTGAKDQTLKLKFQVGSEESEEIEIKGLHTESDRWSDCMKLKPVMPLKAGWHELKILGQTPQNGLCLKAFMLYGE